MKKGITIFFLMWLVQKASAQSGEVLLEEKSSAWIRVPVMAETRPVNVPTSKPEVNERTATIPNRRATVITKRTQPVNNTAKKETSKPANTVAEPPKATETFDRTNSKVGRFKKVKN